MRMLYVLGVARKEHYERTESLSASMAGLEQIKIDTSFGDVKITGADTTECTAIAKINGQAPTLEEARQLAEQTKITLVAEGKVLVFKVEKPTLSNNRSIGVSYRCYRADQNGHKMRNLLRQSRAEKYHRRYRRENQFRKNRRGKYHRQNAIRHFIRRG